MKADLEHYVREMQWADYLGADRVCGLCMANRTELCWNNLRPDAPWRATTFDVQQGMLEYCRLDAHPLHHFPGIYTSTMFLDVLHIMDHHGVASHLIGNVLWTCIAGKEIGRTQEESLEILNQEIKTWYTEANVLHRLPKLKLHNIINVFARTTSAPQLQGPGIKAANTRALVPWVARLAGRLDDASPARRHRRKCAEWLAAVYEILDASGVFLTWQQWSNFDHAISRFVMHYSWLALDAIGRGEFLWNVVPKFHMLCHLSDQAQLLSPKATHTYKEESFVGRLTQLWAALANGPYFETVQKRALTRYLVGLEILLGSFEGSWVQV